MKNDGDKPATEQTSSDSTSMTKWIVQLNWRRDPTHDKFTISDALAPTGGLFLRSAFRDLDSAIHRPDLEDEVLEASSEKKKRWSDEMSDYDNRSLSVGQIIDQALTLNEDEKSRLVAALGFAPTRWGQGIPIPIQSGSSQSNLASTFAQKANIGAGKPQTSTLTRNVGVSAANYVRTNPFARQRGVPNEIRNNKELKQALNKRYKSFEPGWDREKWTWVPSSKRMVERPAKTGRAYQEGTPEFADRQASIAYGNFMSTNRLADPPVYGSPLYDEWLRLFNNLQAAHAAKRAAKQARRADPKEDQQSQ